MDLQSTFPEMSVIEKSLQTMVHRGPDAKGIKQIDDICLFGHRRLKILDLTEAGAQPMSTEDNRYHITYNGEVYNFKELRNTLTCHGHKFSSRSDTEVILKGFQHWGEDLFHKLNGIFAIAIYDSLEQKLFLTRDHLGVKPLYCYFLPNNRGIVFASEIKAIINLPAVVSSVNKKSLLEYSAFKFVSGRRTLFQDIFEVLPGHYLKFDTTGRVEDTCYWDLPLDDNEFLDGHTEELEQILSEAVSMQLVSDVPVGLQLSGGVDSSVIAELIQQQEKSHLNSYSIGFKDYAFDESGYANFVAKQVGTVHHPIMMTIEELFSYLEKGIWHYDEPLNHPNTLAVMHLCKVAKEKVTVLLSGEGPDECFGGYERYLNLLSAQNHNNWDFIENSIFIKPDELEPIYDKEYFHSFKDHIYGERTEIINAADGADWFQKIQYLDIKTYLSSLLSRQDKMGMAASIEMRVPYLDHRIVTYAYRLKLKKKIDEQRTKVIIKDLALKYFPENFVERKKIGFLVPLNEWLTTPKGRSYIDVLCDIDGFAEYLNMDYCRKIRRELLAGENT